jgi:hypothetical protein
LVTRRRAVVGWLLQHPPHEFFLSRLKLVVSEEALRREVSEGAKLRDEIRLGCQIEHASGQGKALRPKFIGQ